MPRARPLDPGASTAACLGALLRRLRTLRGLSQAALGRLAGYDGSYVGAVERAAVRPSRDLVARCDEVLGADGVLLALWTLGDQQRRARPPRHDPPGPGPGDRAGAQPAPPGPADPAAPAPPARPDGTAAGPGGGAAVVEALEVVRLAEASEVGSGTLAEVERAVERLAGAVAASPPELLIPAVAARRRYVGRLLAGRLTLDGRRRLLVAAGWLSALLAELHFDAGEREAAEANRDAAGRLAGHAGDAELAAHAVATLASWALADGRFRAAVELAWAGQDLAPPASATALRLVLDEAQAWTSLGDRRKAAAAHHQATLTRAMLPGPGPGRLAPAGGPDPPAPPAPGLDLAGAAAS
jgi:hypothetical protein